MTSDGNAGLVARVLAAYRNGVAEVARDEGCLSLAQKIPAPPAKVVIHQDSLADGRATPTRLCPIRIFRCCRRSRRGGADGVVAGPDGG